MHLNKTYDYSRIILFNNDSWYIDGTELINTLRYVPVIIVKEMSCRVSEFL